MSLQFPKVLEELVRASRRSQRAFSRSRVASPKDLSLEGLMRAREISGNRIVMCLGAVLTVCAIALPVYAVQTSGGRPNLKYVLSIFPNEAVFNRSPVPHGLHHTAFDPSTTGSIPAEALAQAVPGMGTKATAAEPNAKRPLGSYVVRRVSKGLAFLEGPDGLHVAAPGTYLPGAGKVLAIRQFETGWMVETSETVITQSAL